MDKITKFLGRLTPKERTRVMTAMVAIVAGEYTGHGCKKLKGHANLYRIRVGDIRIVFFETAQERRIILIDRRSESTYHDL